MCRVPRERQIIHSFLCAHDTSDEEFGERRRIITIPQVTGLLTLVSAGPSFVITGLVPVISLRSAIPCLLKRDGRDKPGHDDKNRKRQVLATGSCYG
jgi:hypothetical protein